MKQKNQTIKFTIATLVLIAIVAVFLYVYNRNTTPPQEGDKEITVQVIIPEEELKEYTISTDATTLREALEEEGMIKGEGTGVSFYITEVNGRLANSANEEWWSITKDGEFSDLGVGSINIQDKEKYELTLMIGW
ncbi:MAG: DUF4430 domain-containing protein [Clostridiales bacterium]|nr:DUF4430 domain-containing protein [Clostridiales bacterium]